MELTTQQLRQFAEEGNTVTLDDVWAHYGLTPEEAKRGGLNPQMFNWRFAPPPAIAAQ